MVQLWGPPASPQAPLDLGERRADVLGGRLHPYHPSPSTEPHHPSLGDPAGYPQNLTPPSNLRSQPGSRTPPQTEAPLSLRFPA
uniref:Uncharacterized protein n=1 Tax=Peromyscus maniculatus bairdii TaxID=230844 RepID=A0A8C8U8H5_PERMB